VEFLKEIAPRVTRAAVLRDSAIGSRTGQLAAIQAVAPSFGLELIPIGVREVGEIERSITAFARQPNGSLIVTASTLALVHREPIIALAAKHMLPAIYGDRTFVTIGGLLSYGPNRVDPYRRAAACIDRILKADLPIQAPTKYELVINFKTARMLGITVSPSLLGPYPCYS
jgi:putative tryptophan/tyrosine transport system substrate-binding protein